MAFTQLIDDNFVRADTAPNAALTTTGIGNGWIDVKGNVWRINGNRATALDNDIAELVRPASESYVEQQVIIELSLPVSGTTYFANTLLRVNNTFTSYYTPYVSFSGTNIFVGVKKQVSGGALIDVGTASSNVSVVGVTKLRLVTYAQGTNPTAIKVEAYDITTASPVLLTSQTVSDSEAVLQAAGTYGIYYYGAPFYVTRAATYQDPNPGAPVVKTELPVTDSKYYYPKQGWFLDTVNNQLQTCNPGNYIKARFTGSTSVGIKLSLDTYPVEGGVVISYRLNEGNWISSTITQLQTQLNISSSLNANTTYDLIVVFDRSGNNSINNRWTGTTNILKFGNILIDEIGTFLTPTTKPKKTLFYGDSITEGWYLLSSAFPEGGSAINDYLTYVADYLDSEYAVAAFGSQGWVALGAGNVPVFSETWNNYYSGQSRFTAGSYIGGLDYIFINQGTNDGSSNSTSIRNTVVSVFQAMRAATGPNTKIVVIQPFGQNFKAALSAAVTTYLSSTNDTNFHYVDLGTQIAVGLNSYGQGANLYTTDGLHPSIFGHSRLAVYLVAKLQEVLTVVKKASKYLGRKR
jgi:lysophospholipase L1-like esterase